MIDDSNKNSEMTNETIHLNPERLRIARHRRKMTMKSLAESVGVPAMTITRIEGGASDVDSQLGQEISLSLQIPMAFLEGNQSDTIEPEALSFRARRAMTAPVRDKTVATGLMASLTLSPMFNRRFFLPSLDLPDLSEYQDRPSTAARLLRHHWQLGIGPIIDMIGLVEKKGVEVFWLSEESPCVDAVSFWRDDKPFVIMNSNVKSGERCRFNVAHELAHLVLHRKEAVKDGKTIESQADEFASAFLLAGEQFYYECPKSLILTNFLPLKRRWGVSIQAMIRRGKDLGVYKEYQYERAFKEISSLGWRKKEPHEMICEESQLHVRLLSQLKSEGMSASDIAAKANIDLNADLLELVPTAKRFENIDLSDEVSSVTRSLSIAKYQPHVRVVSSASNRPMGNKLISSERFRRTY